jgi:hypothetical protein
LILVSIRFVASVLTAVVLAGACVPGRLVSEGGEPRAIDGRLGGEEARDQFGLPCFWLTGADGKRTYLLIMDDSVFGTDPLRLLDRDRRTIASIGDTVTAIGPTMAIGDNGCASVEDTFVVDEIIGPGGSWSTPAASEQT